jgi:hypothetical protein
LYDDGCLASETIGVLFTPSFHSDRRLYLTTPLESAIHPHTFTKLCNDDIDPRPDRDHIMEIDSPVEDGAQPQQAPSSPSVQGFAATGPAGQQSAQSAQDLAANQSAANHLSFRR